MIHSTTNNENSRYNANNNATGAYNKNRLQSITKNHDNKNRLQEEPHKVNIIHTAQIKAFDIISSGVFSGYDIRCYETPQRGKVRGADGTSIERTLSEANQNRKSQNLNIKKSTHIYQKCHKYGV